MVEIYEVPLWPPVSWKNYSTEGILEKLFNRRNYRRGTAPANVRPLNLESDFRTAILY